MALETVTYIGDLNPANPPGTDPKSQGDDHIRAGKTAAKNSFAGFTGAILVTGVDGGGSNAYTLTPATPLPGMTAKMMVAFTPLLTNTGASTLAFAGLAAVPVVTVDGAALTAGDLVGGRMYIARYDGVSLRLASPTKRYIDNLSFSGGFPPPPADGRQYVLGGFGGSASYIQTPVGATIQAYKLGAL